MSPAAVVLLLIYIAATLFLLRAAVTFLARFVAKATTHEEEPGTVGADVIDFAKWAKGR